MQKLIDLSLFGIRFPFRRIATCLEEQQTSSAKQCTRSQPRSRSITTLSLIKVIYRDYAASSLLPHARDEITLRSQGKPGFDSKMMKQVTLLLANTRCRCGRASSGRAPRPRINNNFLRK